MLGEIDRDVGEDRVVAAGLAIDAHARREILPAAEPAGRGPPLALVSSIGDPARAAPRAEQDRRSALAPRPWRQRPAIDGPPGPGGAHRVERAHQGAEAPIVIAAQQLEIRTRRATADTKSQAVAGEHLNRLHTMRQLDRMAQWHLQYGDAELDPLGHRTHARQRGQRVEGRAAAAE